MPTQGENSSRPSANARYTSAPNATSVASGAERQGEQPGRRLERARRRGEGGLVLGGVPVREVLRPQQRVARVVVEEPRPVDEVEHQSDDHGDRRGGREAASGGHRAGTLARASTVPAVFVVLAVAPVLQGAAMLAAAGSAAAVLVCLDPRQRAAAMLAALGFSGLAVATLAGDELPGGAGVLAGGAVAALVALGFLAALLLRRPALVGLLAL